MHLALRDVEVDPVEGDDLAKRLVDCARPYGKCFMRMVGTGPADFLRRAGTPLFSRCPDARQCVSGLGRVPPGTCDGARIRESPG
jgi:hypothetical protein